MTKKILSLLVLFVLVATASFAKPKVRIIATGGTIAGVASSSTNSAYNAGQVGIQTLINAVPQIKDLADVSGEQLCNIGSQDMNNGVWLQLANRINQLLNNEGYDGVLVTHGTDTMEETAFFLSLTVTSDKPVILVGSMRPSNAISADGPANVYNGVAAIVTPSSKGRGVQVCMNSQLFDAKYVFKSHTTSLDTFTGGENGANGYVYNGEAKYFDSPVALDEKFDISKVKELAQVGIVYGYANASPLPMQAFINAKYDGIVYAGVGDGNFYKDTFDEAVKARKKGIIIVRSSRVPTGATNLNAEVDDNANEFVASLGLNPQKARIMLMLALTQTKDWKKIQQYFLEY